MKKYDAKVVKERRKRKTPSARGRKRSYDTEDAKCVSEEREVMIRKMQSA